MTDLTQTANQVPPLEPYNLFTSDPVLAEAMDAEGAKETALGTLPSGLALATIAERAVPQPARL